MSPSRRVAIATVAVCAVVGVIALGLARSARDGARVPRDAVTGRASAAMGDSGIFDMRNVATDVPHAIARADAESAAVAFAYGWEAPSRLVFTKSHLPNVRMPRAEVRPTERRHLCDRSYYVRPVVVMPDTLAVRSRTSDVTVWAPVWVVPICDDAGAVKATVLVSDVPMALQVVQRDRPGAVPELTFPDSTFPHIGLSPQKMMDDQGRGIGLSPERAVVFAASQLAIGGDGARVSEVPEALPIVMSVPGPTRGATAVYPQGRQCPRWRLTLDRDVRLRGVITGQLVSTRVVYVARDGYGCGGAATLEIPRPNQPATLPYAYGVYARMRDSMPAMRRGRAPPPPIEFRWTALTVTEPIWFEVARVAPR